MAGGQLGSTGLGELQLGNAGAAAATPVTVAPDTAAATASASATVLVTAVVTPTAAATATASAGVLAIPLVTPTGTATGAASATVTAETAVVPSAAATSTASAGVTAASVVAPSAAAGTATASATIKVPKWAGPTALGQPFELRSDTVRVHRVLTDSQEYTELRVYVDGRGSGSGDATIRAVIYDEAGVLIEEGTEVTITDGQAPSWVVLPVPDFTESPVLIGVHVGGADRAARMWGEDLAAQQVNSVTNPRLGVDDADWGYTSTGTSMSSSRVTNDPGVGVTSAVCFEVTGTMAAGNQIQAGWHVGTAGVGRCVIPVTPGQSVAGAIAAKVQAGTFTSLSFGLRWVDASGVFVSDSTIDTQSSPQLQRWHIGSGAATAPAGAAFVIVFAVAGGATAGTGTLRVTDATIVLDATTDVGLINGAMLGGSWDGTAEQSASRGRYVRVQEIQNPSPSIDGRGWASNAFSGDTVTSARARVADGTGPAGTGFVMSATYTLDTGTPAANSQLYAPGVGGALTETYAIPAHEGRVVRARGAAKVDNVPAGMNLYFLIGFYNAASGGFVGQATTTTITPTAGTWHQFTRDATLPANANHVYFAVGVGGTVPGGGVVELRADQFSAYLEKDTSGPAVEYHTGDDPGWQWEGGAYDSPSVYVLVPEWLDTYSGGARPDLQLTTGALELPTDKLGLAAVTDASVPSPPHIASDATGTGSASAAVTAAPQLVPSATAIASASATVQATARISSTAPATGAASATVTVTPRVAPSSVATGAAAATVMAATAVAPTAAATGAGSASVLVTPRVTPTAAATSAGAASVTAASAVTPSSAAVATGTATVSATTALVPSAAATGTGAATVTATPRAAPTATATASASATVTATTALAPSAAASGAASATVMVQAPVVPSTAATASGAAAVTAATALTPSGAAAAAATASVLTLAILTPTGTGTATSSATVLVTPRVTPTGAATTNASVALTAAVLLAPTGIATGAASSTIFAIPRVTPTTAALGSASVAFQVPGFAFFSPSATAQASTSADVRALLLLTATAAATGTGSAAVSAPVLMQPTAAAMGAASALATVAQAITPSAAGAATTTGAVRVPVLLTAAAAGVATGDLDLFVPGIALITAEATAESAAVAVVITTVPIGATSTASSGAAASLLTTARVVASAVAVAGASGTFVFTTTVIPSTMAVSAASAFVGTPLVIGTLEQAGLLASSRHGRMEQARPGRVLG